MEELLRYYPSFIFVGALIIFIFALIVYAGNPKEKINKYFLLLFTLAAALAFFQFERYTSCRFDHAQFWSYLESFWPFLIALAVHFVLIFTNAPILKKRSVLYVIYLPALIFSLLSMFSQMSLVGSVEKPWGWELAYPTEGMLEYISTAWSIVYLIIIYFVLGRF